MFHIVKDDDGNDVLAMSEVNKYAYSTEDTATIDSTVVEFEPLPHNEPDRLEVGTIFMCITSDLTNLPLSFVGFG